MAIVGSDSVIYGGDDLATDEWVPREGEATPTPEFFAYAEGARRYSGIQTGKV